MQPGRRLVQHVDDPEQVGSHLRRQTQPLQFARRQRRRAAFERQIAQTEVEQHLQSRRHVLDDPLHDESLFRMTVVGPARAAHGIRAGRSDRFSGNRDMSAISIPANVTDRASGFSRLPLQTGQSELDRNCATRRFIIALWVVAKVCSTYLRAPVKVP